jgi:hypothetical protein
MPVMMRPMPKDGSITDGMNGSVVSVFSDST